MIKKEDAIGNTAQEALILLIAKSFDKYFKKQKLENDFIDVLKKGREIFQKELDIPFKAILDLSLKKRKGFILSVVNQLINHYNLYTMSKEIEKEILSIYKKWINEFKINS